MALCPLRNLAFSQPGIQHRLLLGPTRQATAVKNQTSCRLCSFTCVAPELAARLAAFLALLFSCILCGGGMAPSRSLSPARGLGSPPSWPWPCESCPCSWLGSDFLCQKTLMKRLLKMGSVLRWADCAWAWVANVMAAACGSPWKHTYRVEHGRHTPCQQTMN